MSEGSAYVQAEFDFWAALYEPTGDDLEHLRAAWIEHGEAFPESKSINEIEKETRKLSQRTVLVALFATEFDQADLKKPANGWAVHPVPFLITELPDSDVVLRTLMPVRNPWARYFLLRYRPQTWESAQEVVVSNRTSKVVLKRRQ